jgi:integrase
MKLTAAKTAAAALPPGKTEFIYWDDDVPGLGLRLREGGSRTWVFQYKLGSKQRRMSLGKVTASNAALVRKSAEQLHHRVKLGQDPAEDKAEAQREASETFGPLVARFLEYLRPRYRPKSFREITRHLTLYAKPLHALQVGKIGLRDIADLLEALTKNSGAIAANRCRASLSVFFSWLISTGRAEANPVSHAPKNSEASRDRVLTDAELRLVWNALEDDDHGAVVKLLMLTGQRAAEIGGLRWQEVGDGLISLSAARTKNKRPHELPMSAPVRAIMQCRERVDGRELVFAGYGNRGGSWSRHKEGLDARIAKANHGKPLPSWTIHDLRRTAATKMADLGVQPHVIEAVLNHVSGQRAGVAGIYNRAIYKNEKAQALDLWADKLTSIVEGRKSTVTPLRRGV